MKTQHFSSSNVGVPTLYTLPQQWNECLKATSELEEEIPEYVKCIRANGQDYKVDRIYKINEKGSVTTNNGYKPDDKYISTNYYCAYDFKSSSKSAYDKQQEEFKMQELLREAEKRYPVGTKFRTVAEDSNSIFISGGVAEYWPCYSKDAVANKEGEGLFYANGKWAEIIEPKKEVEPWTVGTYVVFLKKYGGHPKGTVDTIIKRCNSTVVEVSLPYKGNINNLCALSIDKECKWFPTLQEAEAFSRELLEEESMEIAGYNVKFEDGKVSIGYYKDITIKELKAFKRVIKFAGGRGDITVTENSLIDAEGNQVLLEEIEELIERLNG